MVIAPKTDHGMKARFRCRDGYTLRGENTTECKYGNWTSEMPYCQEGKTMTLLIYSYYYNTYIFFSNILVITNVCNLFNIFFKKKTSLMTKT